MTRLRLLCHLGPRHLGLRHRFMLAPALALLLICALTLGFVGQTERQTALLDRIAQRELVEYDRYADVLNDLMAAHLGLGSLLQEAPQLDEATLYDRAKAQLNAIHQAVGELEQLMPTSAAEGRSDEVLMLDGVLRESQAYRRVVTTVVEASTLDLALAPGLLRIANAKFEALARAYEGYLDHRRHDIGAEIADRVQQGRRAALAGAAAGITMAVLLLVLSYLLTRLLVRTLERQMDALAVLGREVGAVVELHEGGNELDRIDRAIAVFRALLPSLRAKQRALAQALAAVQRSRDELELRVDERTQALRAANDGLRAEVVLRREVERCLKIYAEVIRSTGEAVVITDLDGVIVEVNPAYEHTVGRSSDELVGRRIDERSSAEASDAVPPELWQALRADGRWTGEILDRRSNGELFPAWTQVNVVRDEHGQPARHVWVSRDISAIKRSEQQLQKLAFYDPLTELPNRALFDDRLRVALATAERQRGQVGVMYIDLDHFKDVNDTLGHPAGDRLLVEVAQRIGRCVRSIDTAARLGGDEFTVLLTQLGNEDEAVRVAQRIIDALNVPVMLGDASVHVGASIGISFYPKDGSDAAAIQKRADLAMYEAKSAGRGQYRLCSDAMVVRGDERLALNLAIEAALDNDEFTLVYQPIVDAGTGHVGRVEALIRWRRPDGSFVSPAVFIPRAEQNGLIRRIDRWVLERACRDAAAWRAAGQAPGVCVNLSALSVQSPDIATTVADTLRRSALPPELLTIEITETAVVADPYAARDALQALMAMGVGVSVDDFGTGYASLSYLTLFPISCIKLDRSFVDRIGKDKASEEVILSMLALARKLDLRVVAEGIEHAAQLAFLGDAGCHHVQGYHLARPMGREQLADWLDGCTAAT